MIYRSWNILLSHLMINLILFLYYCMAYSQILASRPSGHVKLMVKSKAISGSNLQHLHHLRGQSFPGSNEVRVLKKWGISASDESSLSEMSDICCPHLLCCKNKDIIYLTLFCVVIIVINCFKEINPLKTNSSKEQFKMR